MFVFAVSSQFIHDVLIFVPFIVFEVHIVQKNVLATFYAFRVLI